MLFLLDQSRIKIKEHNKIKHLWHGGADMQIVHGDRGSERVDASQ